jgi:hypothetical protein
VGRLTLLGALAIIVLLALVAVILLTRGLGWW